MTREERIHYHTYVTCETPAEHAERIVALEELAAELYPYVCDPCPDECRYAEECNAEDNRGTDGFPLVCIACGKYRERLSEYGIEVGA